MSDNGAMGDEMDAIRRADPLEQELAAFATAVRTALVEPARPAPDALVRRLAATAAATAPTRKAAAAPRRSPRIGFRLARVAIVAALLPLLTAGLAIAGVKLPGPADSAFEKIGIELPSQASDSAEEHSVNGSDDGVDEPPAGQPGESGRENAAAKRGHGKNEANPAREGGRAQGTKGQGRALGKRGLAPGQTKESKSSGGGSSNGNAVGKTDAAPPGQADGSPGKAGDQGEAGSGGGQGSGGGNANAHGKSK